MTATDPQVARWARREQLLVLLSRMQRGVLLPAERDLLRAAVETELTDADAAHAEADRLGPLAANAMASAEEVARLRAARGRYAAALERVNEFGPRLPPVVPGSQDYMNGHCAGWNDAIDAVMLAAALPAPATEEPAP